MKRYRWNVKKFASNMILLVNILLLIWFTASWVDICLHNGLNDGEPSKWNLLIMLFDK